MHDVLQAAIAQSAIALSVFSLIIYLWLGATVLLMGERRSLVTWMGGAGLLWGALFFFCHGALVGAGVPGGASGSDLWWRLAWVPAFAAPLFWAATGLHYGGLVGTWRRYRKQALAAVAAVGTLTAALTLLNWDALAHYGDFIRLLAASVSLRDPVPALPTASPALPALGVSFVVYVALCACLPWASLVARRLIPAHASRPEALGGDPGSSTAEGQAPNSLLLWDGRDAWSRARPALLAASLCMMAAGAVVAAIGVLVALVEHRAAFGVGGDLGLSVAGTRPGHVPLFLVTADLAVQAALAGLGLLVGWAVVRQGILVERRLPQRGILSHWRGMAVVAGILACVVAWMAAIEPEALPDLLVLVTLTAAAYALFTWQFYAAHDRSLAQLRPFVASLTVGHAGWLAADTDAAERAVVALFESLCRDVLGAARARLSLSAGRLRRTWTYEAPQIAGGAADDRREWALPVRDDRGVVARLVLGPRADGAGYTSADLEVARACGQRILDAVGEFAAAQAIASLARQRGLEAELSAALPRRTLHDDVLPRLHLAMLHLEALRAKVPAALAVPVAATVPIGAGPEEGDAAGAEADDLRAALGRVVGELGHVHHDLAKLMRAAPIVNQRRLEHGVVAALRAALDGEFRGTFDALEWDVPEEARAAADALPTIVAELLLGAVLEAVRNAGKHGRGGDLHRHLGLRVAFAADDRGVTATVADDGVGIQGERATSDGAEEGDGTMPLGMAFGPELAAPAATSGTRTGILTHGALLALVGGSLSVGARPGEGTSVTIRVPRGPAPVPAMD